MEGGWVERGGGCQAGRSLRDCDRRAVLGHRERAEVRVAVAEADGGEMGAAPKCK